MDIDGFGVSDKNQLMALGGFLGQFMMVCNTVAKHFSKFDVPAAEVTSPRSPAVEEQKSQGAAEGEAQVPATPRRKILDKQQIETFIYNYVLSKMKMEKLPVQVSLDYQNFLSKLVPPMAVNEMRTMKEPNYSELRKLLTK